MKPKEVAFTRAAIRQFAGLSVPMRDAVRAALSRHAAGPAPSPPLAGPSPLEWLETPGGILALVAGEDRIVVLRLGAEIEAAVAVLRDLATGREERVAESIAARLMRGENAVKVWREHRRVTQAALAKKAGITMDYLSKLETGRRHASDQVQSDILRALGIDALDFGFLIAPPGRGKAKAR